MLRSCFPPLRRNFAAILCHQPCISVRAETYRLKSISQQKRRWRPFQKKSPLAYGRHDGVNTSHYHLCYSSGRGNYMLIASCITTLGTAGCVALIAFALQGKTAEPIPFSKDSTFEIFESPYEVYAYVLGLLFFTIVSAYVVTHTPLRIYYTPAQRNFKFIFQTCVPGFRKATECAPGSLVPVPRTMESTNKLFMGNVAYRKGGKRLLLIEDNFITPVYYNVLMGFDDASLLDDNEEQADPQ